MTNSQSKETKTYEVLESYLINDPEDEDFLHEEGMIATCVVLDKPDLIPSGDGRLELCAVTPMIVPLHTRWFKDKEETMPIDLTDEQIIAAAELFALNAIHANAPSGIVNDFHPTQEQLKETGLFNYI